jgi:penicillin amidase
MVNILGNGIPNDQANANVPSGSGGVTLIVPRRNNGPIVQVQYNPASPTPLTGLSVAYTGWSATHEVETLRRFARAGSKEDFKAALQYFDVGSQNWSYADVNGNIAYYTSGELPIRQDLQTQFFPAGLVHPGLIRDGTNTNKHQWLPLVNPQPNQALSTEMLPFAEMPQVENPPSGYILNANNDPAGTTLDNVTWNQFRAGGNGVLYLSSGYASGERLGRIQRLFTNLLSGTNTLSVSESIGVQANNQLLDAEILSPYLLAAYANATAPGADPLLQAIVADPRIGDAIGRLSAWDFSTPTGIQEGFDPFDNAMATPGAPEISNSVATSIYSLWRGQVVQRVVDRTLATLPVSLASYAPPYDQAMSALRRFLDNYATNGGVGASLINFFRVPGVVDQNVSRDIILLESLRNGLDLAASATFAPAFGGSTDLNTYRWGKLHRVVLAHPLGGQLNIPPSGAPAPFNPLGAALPGSRVPADANPWMRPRTMPARTA